MSAVGIFSSEAMNVVEWMISSTIARCLNALGLVKKEQLATLLFINTPQWEAPQSLKFIYVFCSLFTSHYE